MTDDDDLNDLKSALSAATPAPNADSKAAHISLAKKNFADLQESREDARPTSDRPNRGFIRGVTNMLNSLNPRAALTATTHRGGFHDVAQKAAHSAHLIHPVGHAIQGALGVAQSAQAGNCCQHD